MKMEKENLRKQNNLKEEDLKQKCSQEHREEMKKFISWESVGPYLSRIDVINMRDIRKDGEGEEGKRRLLIDKWEELNGNGATYDDMITATLKAKKREEAEKVCRLVKSTHAPECNSKNNNQPLYRTSYCFCSQVVMMVGKQILNAHQVRIHSYYHSTLLSFLFTMKKHLN